MTLANHPVSTVYNKLRTARLNVKYYCRRLQQTERLNFSCDLILLATAPTSAIAGLWFWTANYGQLAWQILGGIAAIVAVVKPLLLLTKKIKDFEGVVVGYRALEFDLMEIKSNVEQKRKYDVSMQTEFRKALQREKVLVGKTPESREKVDVKAKCEEEVRKELPDECFFIPEDNDDKQANSAATPATPAAVAPR